MMLTIPPSLQEASHLSSQSVPHCVYASVHGLYVYTKTQNSYLQSVKWSNLRIDVSVFIFIKLSEKLMIKSKGLREEHFRNRLLCFPLLNVSAVISVSQHFTAAFIGSQWL